MVQSFGSRPPIGYPGMPSDIGIKYDRTYMNVASDVAQVSTITIGTYAANATYVVSINGQAASVTAPPTGGTTTTVRDQLISEINLYGLGVLAQPTAAGAFTITGEEGETFTISASATGGGAITSALTTPSAASGDVEIGLALVRVATDGDRQARLGAPDTDHTFLGVAIDNGYMIRKENSMPWHNAIYRRGDPMVVREQGRCFVQIEGNVNPSLPVFYRYTGTGKIGAFSGVAGAGSQQLLNARWVSSNNVANGSGGFAELYLGAVVPVPAA